MERFFSMLHISTSSETVLFNASYFSHFLFKPMFKSFSLILHFFDLFLCEPALNVQVSTNDEAIAEATTNRSLQTISKDYRVFPTEGATGVNHVKQTA